ncbi:hypothetical protein [Stappia sp.]|jgi:predicted transcriptional regulator|uniref:hypothetical protein n=1 Tax=Stappia sp. TaxID=1870903 RepID=UPI003A9A5275
MPVPAKPGTAGGAGSSPTARTAADGEEERAASAGDDATQGTRFRTRRLLETYYDLTLRMQDSFEAREVADVLMLVLIAIADLRGAPMDAELLAEKLDASRSTVERRLRPYIENGVVAKERRGKSVVFLFAGDMPDPQNPELDMSVGMVRAVMGLVFDISRD